MPDRQPLSTDSISLTPQQVSRASKSFVALHQARMLRLLNAISPQAQSLIANLPLLWRQFDFRSPPPNTKNLHDRTTANRRAESLLDKTIFTQKAAVNFPRWPATFYDTQEALSQALFDNADPSRQIEYTNTPLISIPSIHASNTPWLCSLWLESDIGTLKQPTRPSITVYLVTERLLSSVEQALWQQRAELFEKWALTFGVHLQHQCLYALSVKESNSQLGKAHFTQEQTGCFELDRFYAKAIWLAGKTALWWYVPPHFEKEYSQVSAHVEKQLQLMQLNTVDFGRAQSFSALELLESMCLCLEKSFNKPLNALFQLSLLETYTETKEDTVATLSHTLKLMIYQDPELESLSEYRWDSNWIWYLCLEQYWLPKGQTRFLDWLRKLWYNWLQSKHSNPFSCATDETARHAFWLGNYQHWKWPTHDGVTLIEASDTGLSRWINRREALSNAFLKSYRRISDNLFNHLPSNAPEVSEWQRLGRKLLAAYEIRAGKINLLQIPEKNRENARYLCLQFKTEDGFTPAWRVYGTQSPDLPPHPAMLWYQSAHLHELLCWCYFNQLLSPALQWIVDAGDHQITPQILQLWLQQFRSHLPLPLFKPRTEAFDQPALLQHLIVMIDLDCHNDKTLNRIDVTTQNSWNEIVTRSFGDATKQLPLPQFMVWLAEALRENLIAQALANKSAIPQIHVLSTHFSNSPWQLLIEHFARTLCENNGLHSIDFAAPRFLWRDEYGFQLLYTKGEKQPFLHQCFADKERLLIGLQQEPFSQGQLHWLETPGWLNHLHKNAIQTATESDFALHCVLSRGAAKGIQILFKQTSEHRAELFCWDHRHGVFVDQVSFRTTHSLIRSLHVFIRSLMDRFDLPDQSTQWGLGHYPIECWEINDHDITLCPQPFDLADLYAFRVQAVLTSNNPARPEWRFYCDQQPMGSSLDLKTQLYTVAQFILSRRQNAEPYPSYLTDVDLSVLPTEIRTLSEHLRQKLLLEEELNNVIKEISVME